MGPARRRAVPILLYHAVGPAPRETGWPWTLDPGLFEAQMAYLAEAGYRTTTVGDLGSAVTASAPTVAITVDDALADFHERVLPVLARYRMTATLYVPTGLVDGSADWLPATVDRRMLSWDRLREAASTGVEVGAHGHTHRRLDRAGGDLRTELTRPREELRQRLGMPVTSLAYPFGDYDGRVLAAARAAGYTSGLTMNRYAACRGDDPLELPRIAITAGTTVAGLRRLLETTGGRPRRAALRAERRLRRAGERIGERVTLGAPRC